jgi:hypothetical protein
MTAFDYLLLALFYIGVGNSLTSRWWINAMPAGISDFPRHVKVIAFTWLAVTWPWCIKARITS